MPISSETIENLRAFIALVCCPVCGQRQHPIETLTSCGHYLCSKCLTDCVLKADNKCVKCFANNYTNDCKEDIFVNNIQKICIKLNKYLDKHFIKSKPEAEVKSLQPKDKDIEPKGRKTVSEKDLIIESLKACVNSSKTKPKTNPSIAVKDLKLTKKLPKKEAKPSTSSSSMDVLKNKTKQSFEYLEEDIEEDIEDIVSIPDSLDNDMFTQRKSQTKDDVNSELVSVILEGLESNINSDRISLQMSPLNESEDKTNNKSSQRKVLDSKSCQISPHLEHKEVQTFEDKPEVTSKSIGIQCKEQQMEKNIQTSQSIDTKVKRDLKTDCCQTNDCCFHKFVESIECQSLQTFLKSLLQLKDISTNDNQTNATALERQVSTAPNTSSAKQYISSSGEPLICSETLVETNSTVEDMQSIQSSESVVDITSSSNQTKDQTIKQNLTKPSAKRRPFVGPKSKMKKLKTYDSNENLLQNNEELESISKINEEKAQKMTKRSTNRKSVENKTQIPVNKSVEKSLTANSTSDEMKVKNENQTNDRKKGVKNGITYPQNGSDLTSVEKSRKESNNDSVFMFGDQEIEKKVESKQKSSRLSVPKKLTKNESKSELKSNEKDSKNKTIEYISSDEEPEEKVVSKPKPKSKTVPKKLSKVKESNHEMKLKDNTTENTSSDKFEEKTESKQKLNRKSDQNMSKKEYISSEDEEPEEKVESKQRSRRKPIEKKSIINEEMVEELDKNESKTKPKKTNQRKRQLSDESEEREEKETNTSIKFKPKPKRISVSMTTKKANKDVFKRPASPAPSEALSDISTSSSSSRQRTSSTERSNNKYYILSSGLNDKQNKRIENLCRELNVEHVIDWSDKVTHLVIALTSDRPKKAMVCPRNAKYMKALLNNKWIVTFDWIVDSYRSNRFIDETNYEISGDRTATEKDLPKISRTSGRKLFEKQMFCFTEKFPLLDEITEFVSIGGGIVVQSIDEFETKKSKYNSNKMIFISESIGLPNTQKDGIKYVSKNAVLTAISNFQTI